MRPFLSHTRVYIPWSFGSCFVWRVETESRLLRTLYASLPWFCVQLDFYACIYAEICVNATAGWSLDSSTWLGTTVWKSNVPWTLPMRELKIQLTSACIMGSLYTRGIRHRMSRTCRLHVVFVCHPSVFSPGSAVVYRSHWWSLDCRVCRFFTFWREVQHRRFQGICENYGGGDFVIMSSVTFPKKNMTVVMSQTCLRWRQDKYGVTWELMSHRLLEFNQHGRREGDCIFGSFRMFPSRNDWIL